MSPPSRSDQDPASRFRIRPLAFPPSGLTLLALLLAQIDEILTRFWERQKDQTTWLRLERAADAVIEAERERIRAERERIRAERAAERARQAEEAAERARREAEAAEPEPEAEAEAVPEPPPATGSSSGA